MTVVLGDLTEEEAHSCRGKRDDAEHDERLLLTEKTTEMTAARSAVTLRGH